MKKAKLIDKQQRFVEEYLVDLNATQAAIRAGYSQKTASRIGPELLGKTCVAEAILKAKNKRLSRISITQDMVVKEVWDLYQLCRVRVPMIGFDGRLVIDESGNPAFKAVDANNAKAALDMLMKHLGAYQADNKRELVGDIAFTWGDSK